MGVPNVDYGHGWRTPLENTLTKFAVLHKNDNCQATIKRSVVYGQASLGHVTEDVPHASTSLETYKKYKDKSSRVK